jgi:hypothetical protein
MEPAIVRWHGLCRTRTRQQALRPREAIVASIVMCLRSGPRITAERAVCCRPARQVPVASGKAFHRQRTAIPSMSALHCRLPVRGGGIPVELNPEIGERGGEAA